MRRFFYIIIMLAILAGLDSQALGERIKDIVNVKGERGNPLIGYGLVVGLAGTGDGAEVSKRTLASLLRRSNIAVAAKDLDAANIASVIVTAKLGPFDRTGSTIDVTVSTMGNSSSLQGGKLLMTQLEGADGRVYAVAQGSIILGGFGASGQDASVTKNHTTVGIVPGGANVEREEVANIVENGEISLLLKNPDHGTAEGIAGAINSLQPGLAFAADAGTIRVRVPANLKPTQINAFVNRLGHLQVQTDQPAVVVINERTGTIIVGQNVSISTVAIAHGSLTITTEEKEYVSQPGPFSGEGATTESFNRTSIKAAEQKGTLRVVPKTLTVTILAQALNQMGLTPRDLIAIFQALKQAGALQAELRTM